MSNAKDEAAGLTGVLSMLDVDASKDTIAGAMNKFREIGLRHMTVYVEGVGLFYLCGDAEMAHRVRRAIDEIDAALDAEEDSLASAEAASQS